MFSYPYLAGLDTSRRRAPARAQVYSNEYEDFAALVNNSQHWVVFRDVPYPIALHTLEARKFLDHRPDLAVMAVRTR
jgi:hypothetical protein